MTRAEKIAKRKRRSVVRAIKNGKRNKGRLPWRHDGRRFGLDCPFDVDMNGMYGTCHCGGVNYNDCLGDI